jgi:transcriptional/translational regulatory protein YebC/TACO1
VSQLTKVAQVEAELSENDAEKVVRFLESLEELDDVQDVYSTADLSNIGVAG